MFEEREGFDPREPTDEVNRLSKLVIGAAIEVHRHLGPVVELKACDTLLPIHRAQVISYLRATGKQLGLLIIFNVALLKDGIRRIVQTDADESF